MGRCVHGSALSHERSPPGNDLLALSEGTRHEGTEASPRGDLTNFVLPGVVGDLHGVQLQALVALADVINPGDIGAHFIHNLHQLKNAVNGMTKDLSNAGEALRRAELPRRRPPANAPASPHPTPGIPLLTRQGCPLCLERSPVPSLDYGSFKRQPEPFRSISLPK